MDSARSPRLEIHGRHLARNAVLNLAGQAAPLLVGVLCIPSVIAGLGPERFGLLALAWAVLGYFSVFDLGLGRATTRFVAESLGRGERHRLPTLVGTAALSQAAFGLVGAGILAVLTPGLVETVLNVPAGLAEEARLTFYLLAASIPLVLVTTSLRGTLEAAQRFDLVNALRAPANAAVFFLPLVGLWLGWQLPGIVGLLMAARGLVLLLHYALCRRVFIELRTWPQLDGGSLRTLLGYGSWVTVSSAVGPILTYLDRFVLGALSGLGAVAFYTAPYEMITRLWVFPASLTATLFPAFSTLEAERERRDALAARSVKYILALLGPAVVCVLAVAPDILRLWLGAEFALQSTRALQVLAVGVLINSLAFIPYALLQAAGRPDIPARLHLMELPVQALLVWWLVGSYGILGAALAWTLRVALDALLLFAACDRLFLLSSRSLQAHRVTAAAVLFLLAGIAAFVLGTLFAAVWARAAGGGMVALVLVISVWRLLLNESDRKQLLGLIRPAMVK